MEHPRTRAATEPTPRQTPSASAVNVLFVQRASGSFGGGSKMLWRLLDGLDDERFDVTLLSQREDEVCRRAAADGVDVEIVPYRGSLDAYNRSLLSQPLHRKAESALRILQFDLESRDHLRWADVVWCDCLRSVLTVAPYVALSETPVIWNVGLGYESTGLRRYLNACALAVADHVFIESRHQARTIFTPEQYERHRDAFVTFHKGIDTRTFAPSRDGDPPVTSTGDPPPTGSGDSAAGSRAPAAGGRPLRVGTAATLTPRKGLEYFVDAAATIADRRDDVTFLVAGETVHDDDRSYRDALAERIEDAGLTGRFEFLGWVDDMPSYYDSLDVFVLPSLNEGIPGAVREAMATAVPTVATDVGGTADVVEDGVTGRLVEPRDADALARAVTDLLDDPALRQRLGTAGRERIVESFSLEQYVRNYERLLLELGGGEASDAA